MQTLLEAITQLSAEEKLEIVSYLCTGEEE